MTRGAAAPFVERAVAALASRHARQATIFTGSTVLVSALGVVTTAILARNLSPNVFGSYSFAVNYLAFAALFFEFGLFPPAARLAALGEGDDSRRVVGAALLIYVPIALCFSLFAFASSYAVDSIFDVHAAGALRAAAFLAGGVPFVLVAQQLAQGVDRLHVWSLTQVLFQGLFLVLLVATPVGISITSALVLRMVALLAASVVAAWWLKPLFSDLMRLVRTIVGHTRHYGFAMYTGRLLSIGTYNTDVLMLAAFRDGRSVGFYTLAGSVAAVAGIPIQGLTTALFARMATERTIGRSLVVFSAVVGLVASLVVWAIAHPFIDLVFSSRYGPAAALVLPLALAQAVRGVTGVYNTYLSAQGRGRELRSANIILTASNVILNLALIPPFGAQGAAWASLVALVVNLAAHVFYYRRALASPAP
jgi:O-antigen/teichoic acid export membrane protein